MPGTGLEPARPPCDSKDLGATITPKYENGADSGGKPDLSAVLQAIADLSPEDRAVLAGMLAGGTSEEGA